MRWTGHVVGMGRREICTKFGLKNLKQRDHLIDLGVKGRLIIKLILIKQGGRM
jgi:hypothetical protein